MRRNDKEQLINYENSIKKSNELSIAKLNHGLSLQQMQILAYAIYCTQQNGNTEFHKADFEKKFGLSRYLTKDAYQDSDKVSSLRFSTENLDQKKFRFTPIFSDFQYVEGVFKIEWNQKFLPHILELKDKYITTDLTITSQFKSSFTWVLYDYLKAHYGYWHKVISKEVLLKLFGVENKKTYVSNTGRFKQTILDVAITELKKYTEFDVYYKEIRAGRTITAFDLHWTCGEKLESATQKQIKELKIIIDVVFDDVFKYVNLKDGRSRERAIELVKELEECQEFLMEPISITKKHADSLIVKANSYLRELEHLKEQDNKQTIPFYNWIEERE